MHSRVLRKLMYCFSRLAKNLARVDALQLPLCVLVGCVWLFLPRRPHRPRSWEIRQIYTKAGMPVPGGDGDSESACLALWEGGWVEYQHVAV